MNSHSGYLYKDRNAEHSIDRYKDDTLSRPRSRVPSPEAFHIGDFIYTSDSDYEQQLPATRRNSEQRRLESREVRPSSHYGGARKANPAYEESQQTSPGWRYKATSSHCYYSRPDEYGNIPPGHPDLDTGEVESQLSQHNRG